MTAGRTRRPTRRSGGRRAGRTVLAICVVVALLWGVDTLARVGAQSVVARRIEAAAGLDRRPEVHVRGLLFLPQLLAGQYGRVEVDLADVTVQGLRLSPVHADLFDVRVPFGDLASGTVDRATASRTAERARIGYDDLNAYLEQQGQPFTVSAGADGGARVTGTLRLAGQPVEVDGEVDVTVQDGAVRITPGSNGASTTAGQLLGFTLPVPELPYGQQLTEVRAGGEGLDIEAGGTDVVLQR